MHAVEEVGDIEKGTAEYYGLNPKIAQEQPKKERMLAQATYICSEFDAESGFDTVFPHLSGFYNAETNFDSGDCLLGGPTVVANSSPSQDIAVPSRTCGKLEF